MSQGCQPDKHGTFTGIVRAIRGEWIDVEITQGVAKAIMRYNVVYEGEVVTVRAGHSYFIKVASP